MQVNAAATAPRIKVATPTTAKLTTPQTQGINSLHCTDCGAPISERIYSYSLRNQGTALCMHGQKKHKIT